jgi:hypothetical protein
MIKYKQDTPRTQFVRQRRTSRTSPKDRGVIARQPAVPSRRPSTIAGLFLPVEPRVDPRRRQARSSTNARQQYEFGFSAANTRVRAPAITLPEFNMRWISAILTAALLFALYSLWNSSMFAFAGAEVSGNIRLGTLEINTALHLEDEPIFKAVPSQLETSLRAAFPELKTVKVRVVLPNRIIVEVTERTPVLAWYQNDALALVDVNGIIFPPRGTAEGLINVVAAGAPPIQLDETIPVYEQPYVPPEMVRALIAMAPHVPAGVPMVYDPQYGMGWQDTRGWQVFFGQTTEDITLKIEAYQAIVDMLVREGRQPTLISLAYLDSPFYK